ncbi:glycoside hydrolase domain-containing protein [Streptomyces sp. NPDC005486]|uniref:glycoside hydrolase domain-containing protein n=1 Tax=Streptomyces sp. NPDC005486 TaxID=3155345 RepID=UPI0033AEE511
MAEHRQSRKRRYITWGVAGTAVLAGAGIAAQTSMAATTWPAQKTYTGRAFDACTAPSLAAMKAWKTDGYYGGAAVYVGGKNRGCAQPNLTASWVKSVNTVGWKLIPLYVGAQPPCQTGSSPEKITAATATSLGATDGADAAHVRTYALAHEGSAFRTGEPVTLTRARATAPVGHRPVHVGRFGPERAGPSGDPPEVRPAGSPDTGPVQAPAPWSPWARTAPSRPETGAADVTGAVVREARRPRRGAAADDRGEGPVRWTRPSADGSAAQPAA